MFRLRDKSIGGGESNPVSRAPNPLCEGKANIEKKDILLLGVTVTLFGLKLAQVENRLFDNIKKTKSAFPEETRIMEFGLALMRDLTQVTQDAVNDYKKKPNLFANHNLFARNRQLLLNAYFCVLSSSYGTESVILRTVLENNNLMRLFNKNPQYAFEWLSKDMQNRFPQETKLKYGKSGKHGKTYSASLVRKHVFDESGKEKVRNDIKQVYSELCNYTHPNFFGWQELVGNQEQNEIILNMPKFISQIADKPIADMLFLMQLSFKTFAETFKGYLAGFAVQLKEWQDNFKKLIVRYIE